MLYYVKDPGATVNFFRSLLDKNGKLLIILVSGKWVEFNLKLSRHLIFSSSRSLGLGFAVQSQFVTADTSGTYGDGNELRPPTTYIHALRPNLHFNLQCVYAFAQRTAGKTHLLIKSILCC